MTHRRRVWLLILAALMLAAAPPVDADEPAIGGPSLRELIETTRRSTGADIVYSGSLVGDSLRVGRAPRDAPPIERLRAALAEHGLSLRGGGDTWYVVRLRAGAAATGVGTLVVFVRNAEERFRIAGAALDVTELTPAAEVIDDGAFRFVDVPAGRYRLHATAPGHHPATVEVMVTAGDVTNTTVALQAREEVLLDTIVVSTSRYAVLRKPAPSLTAMDAEVLAAVPAVGEDPLRIMRRLPGAASGGVSARVHFRGGTKDETLLLLDGLELVEPFHLRDYQSLFSAIDKRILASVDVYTGGFPASYGEALSGVIAMRSLEPVTPAHEVSLSFLNTSVLTSGTFANADGEWLVSARRGNLDLLIDEIDPSFGDPSYSDAFARLGYRLGQRSSVAINAFVASDDVLVVTEAAADERVEARSDTDNAHVWAVLNNELRDGLNVRSLIAWTELDNHRRGFSNDAEAVLGSVDDRRETRSFAVKSDWHWQVGNRETSWGLRWARADADYDYQAQARFFELPAELAGDPPPLARRSVLSLDGEEINAYLSHRFAPGARWVTELGLRWDKQSWTPGREQWSPRVNLLYRLSDRSDLRLSAGRFHQSQRIHALQVEDGVQSFFPAERADQVIVGYERRFARDVRLRVEGYHKRLRRLRPRYENLFDPLAILPELEPDRVRVAPARAHMRGIEILLARDGDAPLEWWASYALSRATDRIDGRDVERSWDQRHALSAGLTWHTPRWEASVAAAWRSGWPTTPATLQTAPGEDEEIAVVGERNSEDLGDFATVDVHVARHFDMGATRLTVYLDILNLLNRQNPCCVEYDRVDAPGGGETLERETDDWLPFMPSLGVRWEF